MSASAGRTGRRIDRPANICLLVTRHFAKIHKTCESFIKAAAAALLLLHVQLNIRVANPGIGIPESFVYSKDRIFEAIFHHSFKNQTKFPATWIGACS